MSVYVIPMAVAEGSGRCSPGEGSWKHRLEPCQGGGKEWLSPRHLSLLGNKLNPRCLSQLLLKLSFGQCSVLSLQVSGKTLKATSF